MIHKQRTFLLALFAFLILCSIEGRAQGNGRNKKEDKNKAYKKDKDKDYKEGTGNLNRDNTYKNKGGKKRTSETWQGREGVIGRVILPRPGTASPRQLAGVPKGHYPPPGSCRVWYPNRPPGHQPAPTNCDHLRGIRLEPGAFILHGGRAYDAEYDWRQEERRRPGTVTRDILDILFPNRV